MSPAVKLNDVEHVDVEHVDVVIVGGGPTGLATGLLLHRLGVSVSVIDGKPASLDLGRADALNARTQQYLELANLLDDLTVQGLECNTSSTFGNGEFKTRQNAWWVGLQHCLHKNFLMIGQPVVEKIISDRLGPLVHYGEKAVSVTEDESCVEVVTDSGRIVMAKYALGADGARSFTRAAIGATFTGTKPEMLWAVLDTFIDTDFPECPEIITFELHGQSRVSWIPRERGLCRFYVLLDGEVTCERAQESIKEHMAPHKVDFIKTEWYSTFDVKERIADTFISKQGAGRIFLGGDAAHVHSVNGGQGLNTGIADAFSLAWRLAMVLKNPRLTEDAARKILHSYDVERRSTAQGVIDVAAALVRDTVREAKTYVGTIERNAGYITGMGVAYDECASPIVAASAVGMWKAGFRCPDVVITPAAGGDSRWLYQVASYGKFVVLQVGEHQLSGLGFEKDVSVYKIQAAVEDGVTDANVESFVADWITPEDSAIVVVRPDFYIAHVGRDVESAKAYLGSLFHQEQ